MGKDLDQAQSYLARTPEFADLTVRRAGEELHLWRGDVHFARLIPSGGGRWHLEYFHNLERWERVDFQGPLEECLEFFRRHPHYVFWEG